MAKRDAKTTKGGNRAYKMVRSKVSKGKDGYGKVVSAAREKLMQKSGKDPGYNTVAKHEKDGSHFEEDGGKAKFGSRASNTADANKKRKFSDKIKEKKK